jgi:mannose/fructose/N-acetylgalactosamine-specific phosphotransferase system component IIC
MNGVEIGALSLLGGLLGLDVVSFPQAMLSRPIVAATISAALLGAPERGIVLGATLECFALETLPVGASRYPEWGSSSVVGAAVLATAPASAPWGGALVLGVLAALAWAWVGGWSMVKLRQLNARWARSRHDAVARGSRRTVIGLQLFGMTADLVRGAAMTAIGCMLFQPLSRVVLQRWSLPDGVTVSFLVALAGIVAAGAVHKVFHAVPGARWLLVAGVAVGGVILGMMR